MEKNYFYNFMLYCLARLNLSVNFVSDDKKNKIVSYLRYMKANGMKANLDDVKGIIKNENV